MPDHPVEFVIQGTTEDGKPFGLRIKNLCEVNMRTFSTAIHCVLRIRFRALHFFHTSSNQKFLGLILILLRWQLQNLPTKSQAVAQLDGACDSWLIWWNSVLDREQPWIENSLLEKTFNF